MPNRISTFFSQWYKRKHNIAADPAKSPFALGKVVLDELAECKRRLADLENRPVHTSFEGDHARIDRLVVRCLNDCKRINALELIIKSYEKCNLFERLEHLEEAHFKKLTRRISAPNWQRPRRKDGRWIKKNGAGDDAR